MLRVMLDFGVTVLQPSESMRRTRQNPRECMAGGCGRARSLLFCPYYSQLVWNTVLSVVTVNSVAPMYKSFHSLLGD